METATFSVDASLLAELGERLIGRAPIALAELVKNSYDADASICRIRFGDDSIIVSDDGSGISQEEFRQYWLRLGTTHKIDKDRSEGGRALTGSKGIGRLSVQFLADKMTLETTSRNDPGRTLHAKVNWKEAKRGEDLTTVKVKWEMRDSPAGSFPSQSESGTRITLTSLKNKWDAEELAKLGEEVWRLRSPFKRSTVPSTPRGPKDFDIEVDAPEIEEAREAFDRTWRALFENWRARIRGNLDRGRHGGDATVSLEFKEGFPDGAEDAAIFREAISLPVDRNGQGGSALLDKVTFEILVFKTRGRQKGGIPVGELREYLAEYGNVSVYDAGFRLPYYGSGRGAGQDWLNIALDQGRRLNQSQLLPEHLRTANKYMQDLPAPGRIFGAVEIDTNHERTVAMRAGAKPGEWLQIQPGRDRLHDNAAFGHLRDLVRFSLDFYASRHRLRSLRAVEAQREGEPPSKKYGRALEVLDQHKSDIPHPVFLEVHRELRDARQASAAEEKLLESRAALLAPLATAGMAALALRHELAREIRLLDSSAHKLEALSTSHGIPELAAIAGEFTAAKDHLHSLSRLFAPLTSKEDSEAVHRLRVRAVADQVVEGMRSLTPGVRYDTKGISEDLRFPLGSLAEWNALLQNIFSNAWNAMLDSSASVVRVSGGREKNGKEWLRISDTGQGLELELDKASELFEPFERRLEVSPDNQSLVIGGQGLGLAIVRMITGRRGARCEFVNPEEGFSTTLEISWSGGKQ